MSLKCYCHVGGSAKYQFQFNNVIRYNIIKYSWCKEIIKTVITKYEKVKKCASLGTSVKMLERSMFMYDKKTN